MELFTKKGKFYLLILIIFSILFLLIFNFYQKEVKNFFYSISRPIQKFLWKGGQKISGFFEAISQIQKLKEEKDFLELENQKLLAEISLLKELEKENIALREALDIDLQKEFKLEIVRVIGKDLSQDSLFIDKGEIQGLSKGQAVILPSKALVGKIDAVYKNHSEVILISNKNSKISVKVGQEEIEGLLEGQGNFQVLIDLLPREKEIKSGDLVFTTGREGNLPRGLLIGKVSQILSSDIEPHQKAKLDLAFDIKKIEFLFVITHY